MKGRRNLWLLGLVAVFAASWYFGAGRAPEILNGNDEAEESVAEAEEPAWVEDDVEDQPVHLKVLNGTEVPGLARDFSLLLGRAGCVAESVGNAPHDHFERTLLVNRRLESGRARALARFLGGVDLVEEWDDRTGEDAVLVLGRDHTKVAASLEEAAARERERAGK